MGGAYNITDSNYNRNCTQQMDEKSTAQQQTMREEKKGEFLCLMKTLKKIISVLYSVYRFRFLHLSPLTITIHTFWHFFFLSTQLF